ncbi:MAG: metalloregulator ArsR/SmtB family transcription factor [bacterium]|nr:metalloregulator ArsR/SmtB family transcription factor [bacterium]
MLRTLAHPVRLAILEHLRHRSACVCHLTRALGRPQAHVSQQLAILRDAGLIEGQRDGAFIYYKLCDCSVLAVVDLVSVFLGRASAFAPPTSENLEGCECPQCSNTALLTKGPS